jgi:hypothetical protein
VRKLKKMNLYPRLIPFVGVEWLSAGEMDLLGKLSTSVPQEDDGTLRFIVSPRVEKLGKVGFMIMETGADYSGKVRRKILDSWSTIGAGETLLSLIQAAQGQGMPKLVLTEGGMYPEEGSPSRIGKIGGGKIPRKKVKILLKSLKAIHEGTWPIEQLANTVEPYAKLTR